MVSLLKTEQGEDYDDVEAKVQAHLSLATVKETFYRFE